MDWLSLVLGIVPLIAGIAVVGKIIGNLRALLREAADVLDCIDAALEDKNITKEEIGLIKKESLEVWAAIKDFGK